MEKYYWDFVKWTRVKRTSGLANKNTSLYSVYGYVGCVQKQLTWCLTALTSQVVYVHKGTLWGSITV